LELTLSEPMRAGSLAKARITLAGQEIAAEHVQLSENGRRVLVGASPSAGQQLALRVEGLEDRSGNLMQPLEVSFAVADSGQYQVLLDAASPQVLAMLDEAEGVSVLFDEPVVPAAGRELGSSITVTRAGAPVAGSVTRISPWQLAWKASDPNAWLLGGEYRVSIAGLVELGPEQKPVSSSLLPASFTHLASPGEKILVASPPPETPPRASSAFGNTTLFQGRLWVPELGLYYYRARWYDPQLGDFLERDPLGPVDSPNLYQALGRNPVNITDPQGLYEKDFHFYAVYYLARAAGFAPADARLLAWSSQYVDDYEHTQPVTLDFRTLGAFHFLSPATVRERRVCQGPAYGEPQCEWHLAMSEDPVMPENEIARANLNRAAESGSLVALGIALHSWADTFAHSGFTGLRNARNQRPGWVGDPRTPRAKKAIGELVETGHSAAGHWPDWPYMDVQKATSAAESIYRILVASRNRMGYTKCSWFICAMDWSEIEPRVRSLFEYEGTEDERSGNWKLAIWQDFYEWVDYRKAEGVPEAWVRLFQLRAEEQRNFVLKLYGLR
jgi:RHS repeat-associated protein